MGIERFAGRLVPGWRKTQCLFLLSTGRVGTVTLVKLLNLSPRTSAFHEPSPRCRIAAKQAYYHKGHFTDFYRKIFNRARRGSIGWARMNRLVYAESTFMIYFAPLIAELLPNARFAHVHRHPAEFVRSGMNRGWYHSHPWDTYRLEPSPDHPDRPAWESWPPFGKILWFWQAVNEYILTLPERIGGEKIIRLGFDDLMNPETGTYRELFELINTPPTRAADVAELLQTKHNAQRKGDFPPYPQWDDQQRDLLKRIAGPTMAKLGYEIDPIEASNQAKSEIGIVTE